MGDYIPFFIFLFIFAILLRDEFVFTVLYLFLGLYLIGRWTSKRAIGKLAIRRDYTTRAFIGEDVPVHLEIANLTWLPVVWLRIQDALPVELAFSGSFKRVISLGSYAKYNFDYTIQTRKRGFYQVGPFSANAGDLFGLGQSHEVSSEPGSLTVYPRIYNLPGFSLPSRSPLGTLHTMQPIFEDPTRVRGKRDYVAGDSLRRVDWKASAVTGHLQTKQFEPSIALETMIFLNVDVQDFDLRMIYEGVELSVILAASVANWVIARKQAVGISTNGVDPLSGLPESAAGKETGNFARFQPVLARKGRNHLMLVLDVLARLEAPKVKALPFLELLRNEYLNLPWGTTLVLITPSANEELFDMLFLLRRSGLDPSLVLAGPNVQIQRIRQQAEAFHIPFTHIQSEMELSRLNG
jgi:uncharacterized protein (DUF58 family)